MPESTLTEKVMETRNIEDLKILLSQGRELFLNDPNNIILPSDKNIVLIGDIHGDYRTLKAILERYSKENTLVFLGDYIDRATEPFGSIWTSLSLIEQKINNPDSIFLLRGNHEFRNVNRDYGFFEEIKEYASATNTPPETIHYMFNDVFKAMPYIASADNGVICLHGGIPNIENKSWIEHLPKDVNDPLELNPNNGTRGQKQLISQIVWNDNEFDNGDINLDDPFMEDIMKKRKPEYNNKGYTYNPRINYMTDADKYAILYGKTYFDSKMKILDKKILVRGHNQNAKGYSLNDKVITVFSSSRYHLYGNMKGVYVAVLDPQKEITTAKDLRIEHIK